MREAYNGEEVDILKYGQGRSVLKEKQKKLNFFEKGVDIGGKAWYYIQAVR